MAAGKLSADPDLQSLALEGEQLDKKGAQRPNLLQSWTLPADMTHLEVSSPAVGQGCGGGSSVGGSGGAFGGGGGGGGCVSFKSM